MRVKPLQIHWHNKQPIFSLDFAPRVSAGDGAGALGGEEGGRLATCGGDSVIRLWRIHPQATAKQSAVDARASPVPASSSSSSSCSAKMANPATTPSLVEYLASLAKHTGVVNAVRWAPQGDLLASAGDDGMILIWKQSEVRSGSSGSGGFGMADTDEGQKESWVVTHLLRGPPMSDIYDLCWSPDAKYVLTGSSIDNSARIWEVASKRHVQTLSNHVHFVQGVAWDPKGEFLATQSCDRSMNVFRRKVNGADWTLAYKSSKVEITSPRAAVPVPVDMNTSEDKAAKRATKSDRIYHDETLVSFFRRLSFSPDGSLLLAPAGIVRAEAADGAYENCVHVYLRGGLQRPPVACYVGYQRPAVVVRFSPVFYEHVAMEQEPLIRLPYRMVFAVGTQNSIFIHDTQRMQPLVQISNIHYATITDLAWSSDGQILMVSSSDGFCSIVCFEDGDLGKVYIACGKEENALLVEAETEVDVMETKEMCGSVDGQGSTVAMEVDVLPILPAVPPVEIPIVPAAANISVLDPAPTVPGQKRRIVPTFVRPTDKTI